MARMQQAPRAAGAADRGGRLKGHIALVTGADSGIGQATAIAFAREGADVAITYHTDEAGAGRTRDEAEAAGARVFVTRLDQRIVDEVRRVFREAVSELGTPTILVNNAGVNALGKPTVELTDEEWENVIRTDLYGPFYCSREFVQHLRRLGEGEGDRRGGVIINVTSVHESIPMVGAGAYDSAKGGLRNLTRTLALELAKENVRVVNLAPGMILTAMNQEAIDDPQKMREQTRDIPMKRAGQPQEVAAAAVFLASDGASYVHGSTLFVDGGLMQTQ